MANYPKTKKTETTEIHDGKWRRAANTAHFPKTTKYTRWYGNDKIVLFHEIGPNRYTFIRIGSDNKSSSYKEYKAKSLKEAQKLADLMIENEEM